jgi:hypothetical protein
LAEQLQNPFSTHTNPRGEHMIPFSLNTTRAKRPVRQRIKREVIDVPLCSENPEEMISTLKVSGTKAWAKMVPGSIKLVKRMGPQLPA